METPEHITKELSAFPAALLQLVNDELEAGNGIAGFARAFPAPRDGVCAKLTKPVTTRARESSPGVHFREWNSLSHAGEFTDAHRRYFVLEPPHPPSVEKNMDSIREELDARERASRADRDLFY
ncbi:MAG: hypothetical protein JNL39_04645 [Opitutaceae bacterium]|nr:hypothetical protein [Opitutaceae bacterium]